MDQGSTRKRSAVHNFAPTVTKFCVMWEGLSLPHDTKFGNSRCEIVGRRVIFIWSLIHGLRWSGLIKVGPGWSFNPAPVIEPNYYLIHGAIELDPGDIYLAIDIIELNSFLMVKPQETSSNLVGQVSSVQGIITMLKLWLLPDILWQTKEYLSLYTVEDWTVFIWYSDFVIVSNNCPSCDICMHIIYIYMVGLYTYIHIY